ncbi:MAG: signal peptidase II [Candidatus Woesearchaeota archaeon]
MARKYLSFWNIAVFVFILDRITKLLVTKYVPLNSSIDFPFFSISHVLNTGTVFGLFKNASWFFIIFAASVSVFLILKHKTFSKTLQPILGLILGGALGNLLDRLVYGAVVDFIDFHFWPAFNIADSAVTVAIILLLYREYALKKRNI